MAKFDHPFLSRPTRIRIFSKSRQAPLLVPGEHGEAASYNFFAAYGERVAIYWRYFYSLPVHRSLFPVGMGQPANPAGIPCRFHDDESEVWYVGSFDVDEFERIRKMYG